MTRSDQIRTARLRREAQRKAEGLCLICGKVPPRANRQTCESCAARQSAHAKKHHAKRIPLLVKLKICLHCRRNAPVHGQTLCGMCAEAQVDRQRARRARRKTLGLCSCGAVPETPGAFACDRCKEARNRFSHNYYLKNKKAA